MGAGNKYGNFRHQAKGGGRCMCFPAHVAVETPVARLESDKTARPFRPYRPPAEYR